MMEACGYRDVKKWDTRVPRQSHYLTMWYYSVVARGKQDITAIMETKAFNFPEHSFRVVRYGEGSDI